MDEEERNFAIEEENTLITTPASFIILESKAYLECLQEKRKIERTVSERRASAFNSKKLASESKPVVRRVASLMFPFCGSTIWPFFAKVDQNTKTKIKTNKKQKLENRTNKKKKSFNYAFNMLLY